MKKLLLLLILILISNITFALPITLKEYMAKNSAWSSSDKALLSHITNRCGVMFGVMSEYYKTLDEGNIYEITLEHSLNFSKVSSEAYEEIGGETKAFQKRAREWAKIYDDAGIKNISDHGVFSHGDIKSDVSTCMDYLNSNILK